MFIDHGFRTAGMDRIFSAEARVEAMLRFESAFARARAEVGTIPPSIAAEIESVCARTVEDPERLLSNAWMTGTPVLPLLDLLRRRLSADAATQLHQGATSQDAIDTAMVLQVKAGLRLLDVGLFEIGNALADLAKRHRATAMLGRTFLQAALPTTLGFRAVLWLASLIENQARIREAMGGLPLQLGGPVGNLGTLGEKADTVVDVTAGLLGLRAPDLSWHTDRRPISSVLDVVARTAHDLAKIALDVALLAQPEVGELRTRAGQSSSMPGKRNPIDGILALAANEVCANTATLVTSARPHELDRALSSWHTEWYAVPVVFSTCSAVLAAIARLLDGLEVDEGRMRSNLKAAHPDTPTPDLRSRVDSVLAQWNQLER